MEVWCYCWSSIFMVVLLLQKDVLADLGSETQYVLSQTSASFDQAIEACTPGVLTTMTTEYEVQQILALVNKSVPFQEGFPVWIGLKKMKKECSVSSNPLRGFKWVENGSQDSKIRDWIEEPKLSCTGIMCAALKLQVFQPKVKLGLIPVSCKSEYPYICKIKGGLSGSSVDSRPTTIRPSTVTPEPRLVTSIPKPGTPEPRLVTSIPKPGTPVPSLSSPGPNTKLTPSSRPTLGSDRCQYPNSPDIRSFTLDSSNNSRIQVECWSAIKLHLFCLGHPNTWQMLDGSPANFSSICIKCADGFQKNASGHCVDIDECNTSNPCRHTCLNTEGSYKCICADDTDEHSCKNTARPVVKSPLLLILILFLLQGCWDH